MSILRIHSKKVLLVAPENYPGQLLAGYDNIRHISSVSALFPNLYELKPDVVFFDYALMGEEFEKVLRRLRTNAFYRGLKIYCYKKTENTKVDSLLKVLGVDHIIFDHELQKISKNRAAFNAVSNLLDASVIKWVAGAAN